MDGSECGVLPKFITTDEASQILTLSKAMVTRLAREGAIEGFKAGKSWRLRRDSVLALAGIDEERGSRAPEGVFGCVGQGFDQDSCMEFCRSMVASGYAPTQWSPVPAQDCAQVAEEYA